MLHFTREEAELCEWLLGTNSIEIINPQMGSRYSGLINRTFFPYPGTVLQLLEQDGIEQTISWVYKILRRDPLPQNAPDEAKQLYALIYTPHAQEAYGQDQSYLMKEAVGGYPVLIGNISKIVCLRYLVQKAEAIQAYRAAHPGALPELTSDWVKESITGVVEELRGNRAVFSPDWFDIELEKMRESKSKWQLLKSFHNIGRIFLLSRRESFERKILFYLNVDACRHLINSFIKEGKNCGTKLQGWVVSDFSVRAGGALWLCVALLLLKFIVGLFLLSGLLVSGFTSLPVALLCDAARTFSITHPRTPLSKKMLLATLTGLDLIKDIMLIGLISSFISLSLLNTMGMSLFVIFTSIMVGVAIEEALFCLARPIISFVDYLTGRRPEIFNDDDIDLINRQIHDLEEGRPQQREGRGFYPRYDAPRPMPWQEPDQDRDHHQAPQQDHAHAQRDGFIFGPRL